MSENCEKCNKRFSKPNETSNVSRPTDFTVTEKKRNRKILIFRTLESENCDLLKIVSDQSNSRQLIKTTLFYVLLWQHMFWSYIADLMWELALCNISEHWCSMYSYVTNGVLLQSRSNWQTTPGFASREYSEPMFPLPGYKAASEMPGCPRYSSLLVISTQGRPRSIHIPFNRSTPLSSGSSR